MSNIDTKSLKKLADICRKAGIKSFKSPEFEFTLTDEKPISDYKAAKNAPVSRQGDIEQLNSLTEEEMLFWSTGDPTLSNGS